MKLRVDAQNVDAANRVLSYSYVGSEFVFGPLGQRGSSIGFIFAFQVLPTVIFICALFAILYHYGIMQFIIRIAAWAMTSSPSCGARLAGRRRSEVGLSGSSAGDSGHRMFA